MKKAALLENKQLSAIFLNLEELIQINDKFTEQLSKILQEAEAKNDEVNLSFTVCNRQFISSCCPVFSQY